MATAAKMNATDAIAQTTKSATSGLACKAGLTTNLPSSTRAVNSCLVSSRSLSLNFKTLSHGLKSYEPRKACLFAILSSKPVE